MPEKESTNKKEQAEGDLNTLEKIHELPKHYFTVMNAGSELAKKGQFEEAVHQFEEARKEVGKIIQQLLEMPKDPTSQMFQFFGILWAFKLIKAVFYWLLAKSETADTARQRKELLMAAVGAQQVGADMVPAFETLNQSFKGVDLELLPMLGEVIRNYEERQRILEKALEEQGLNFRI